MRAGRSSGPRCLPRLKPNHLKHLSFLLFAGLSPSTASKAGNTDSGIGHRNDWRGGSPSEQAIVLKSKKEELVLCRSFDGAII